MIYKLVYCLCIVSRKYIKFYWKYSHSLVCLKYKITSDDTIL